MNKIALIVFFLAVFTATAQDTAKQKITKEDWDLLDKRFVSLVDALLKNDKTAFFALSLKEVDCIDCVGRPEFNNEGYFVPATVFYLNIAKNFDTSPVYKAMVKRGYVFDSIILKGFKPKNLPKDGTKDLVLYEVWVPTYLARELSKNSKGASHGFQFVKINGDFKFYGLTSIP
jgi:hypothetical protein